MSRDVEALAGTEVTVNLELGSVISGILYFGDDPAAGVEVHLNSSANTLLRLVCVTDDHGGFAFSGLKAGSRFYLFAGWNVTFVDPAGEHNVDLVAPATDLALRARRHPGIRGTVVDSDGATVGEAAVKIEFRTDEGQGGSSQVSTGEDGRFEVSARVAPGALISLKLIVAAPDGGAREVIELNSARLGDDGLDLGKIVLRAPRTFEFLVLGPDGKPVTGAIVLATDDPSRASSPTDASGKTELEVAADTPSVRAGAAGAGVAEVKLPGGTLLNVRIRTPAGEVPRYLYLVLEADSWLLEGTEDMTDPVYDRAGASHSTASHSSEKESHAHFPVPRDGQLQIAGIRPGTVFRLAVVDNVSGRRHAEREMKLETRERRDLDVVVPIVDRTLVVRVQDAGGKAMPGALVQASAGAGAKKAEITVPATGSVLVRFTGMLTEPVIHQIRLTPTSATAGTEVTAHVDYIPGRKHWEILVPAVLPGKYRVTLEYYTDSNESGEDLYETCRTGQVVEVAEGREIETHLP